MRVSPAIPFHKVKIKQSNFLIIDEIDYNKPINYYCKIYNLSENALRNRFKKLGIYNNFIFVNKNSSVIRREQNLQNYYKNPKLRKECQIIIDYDKTENNFCCLSCATRYSRYHF
jgi:hypothetical protein